MRVVLDTTVLVAGLQSQLGASNRVLAAVAARRCIPLVTTAIFFEYESVLLRETILIAERAQLGEYRFAAEVRINRIDLGDGVAKYRVFVE